MLLGAEPRGKPLPLPRNAPTLMEATMCGCISRSAEASCAAPSAHVRAVDGVDVVVHEGETVGLVGESGSGKSTMGYAMLRLVDAAGDIRFAGADLADIEKKRLRRLRADMQIVFQDPFSSLSPRLTVAEIVAEGLSVHEPELTRWQRGIRVALALKEVGLAADIGDRYPHEFSGGQRQRIAIARAMVLKPRFVVLDEPTSALDMSVQAQIVDLLQKLQADHQLGYLFISHDLRVVRALAHRIVVLRQGRVVEHGPADQILNNPQHDYTRALVAAAFTLDAVDSGEMEP